MMRIKNLHLRLPRRLAGRASSISKILEKNIDELSGNKHQSQKRLFLRIGDVTEAMSNKQIADKIAQLL